MDQNIGKLIATLEANGELDNTLIMFVADNGACAEGGQLGGGNKELLGTREGYFLSYGQSWANVSNTPFRKYKHWVHEGGISSPLIMHWPSKMAAAAKGRLTDQYGFFQDIMATCVEAAELAIRKNLRSIL
ncbi:sulfatase-like hydrolase/transferase [Niabella hibiscisoli]|uniref:sulfatase-like hydrolase/transferase n=1 Tax=Niabella hibiscisoli TaxID=1825928 RepID=UPI0021D4365B|nr:sulfatase-like hydrolase/transferase [Niabella hibiscisoli]